MNTTPPPSASAPEQVLAELGWDDAWATSAQNLDVGACLQPARVVRVDRGLATTIGGAGVARVGYSGRILEAAADDPASGPCVGDWALVARWTDDRSTLEHLLPRRSCVTRAQSGGTSHAQALAANVTLAAVVVGLDQAPAITKIERLVALAWESGAQPLVLLTKADLAADAAEIAADVLTSAPGAEVMCCSCVDATGLSEVRDRLGDGTMALLGSSGAGKSSLVNALVGADVLATKEIRADGRGRHTSVRRELVVLPGGGCMIDTPGLRGVGLSGGEGIAATFADVDALAAQCRFNDCSHESEPGCAVLAAVEEGTLAVRRLESWRKLQREAAWVARRTDARLRAAELRVWKQRTKGSRGHPKRR